MKHESLDRQPRFPEVTTRWDAFWRGETTGPLVAAVVPKPGTEPVEKPPYGSGHDGDFDPVVAQIVGWADTHEFLGDAIPYYYAEFAADHFTSLLGVDLTFPDAAMGGWPVHRVTDWEQADIRFHREGKWWDRTVGFIEAIKKRLAGRIMIASPTLVANLDSLVALAGVEKVLIDLVERPDEIDEALDQVMVAYREILDAFAELLEYDRWGSINRHGMWCDGRINVAQSDFSCMLSSEMFDRFVYPALLREMEELDQVEYHLDGPDAIRHAEKLCGIPRLDIMQWVPGAGEAQQRDWIDLYERFDRWGKGQILGGSPDRCRLYRSRLTANRLFLNLGGLPDDRAESLAILEELQQPADSHAQGGKP